MRVLHFIPVYAPAWHFGGPVLSVSRVCEGLVQKGVDVRVITTNAGLPNIPASQLGIPQNVNGVEVIYYPVDKQHGPIKSRLLIDSLPDHMAWADLLHMSSIWQPLGLPVQQAAHCAEVPVIQTLRGALGPYSWRRGWWKKLPYFLFLERPLLQRVAAIHCTTAQEAREIKWLRLKQHIEVLSNPIDLSKFYSDTSIRADWRRNNRIHDSEVLFIVAGRLHHKKGLDLLPKALQSIRKYPWQLVIIGDDADGSGIRLRRALKSCGLLERCHWLASVPSSELIGPLNAADWLLLPSRHENFGNIVIEALASGCGVAVSNSVGVREALASCPGIRNGIRTTDTWTNILKDLLDSQRPGTSSESWVKERFSQQAVVSQLLTLYDRII